MEVISKITSNPGSTMSKSTVLGDEKMPSPSESAKTESSVPFDGFSSLSNEQESEQDEEGTKRLSKQLPGEDRTSDIGEQVFISQSPTTAATVLTSVKTEASAALANTFRSNSPGTTSVASSQDQVMSEEQSGGAYPKIEDVDDVSSHSTPIPSQLNPGACQDEDSQLSFNQESQSSDASLLSVRWPKVGFSFNFYCFRTCCSKA